MQINVLCHSHTCTAQTRTLESKLKIQPFKLKLEEADKILAHFVSSIMSLYCFDTRLGVKSRPSSCLLSGLPKHPYPISHKHYPLHFPSVFLQAANQFQFQSGIDCVSWGDNNNGHDPHRHSITYADLQPPTLTHIGLDTSRHFRGQ